MEAPPPVPIVSPTRIAIITQRIRRAAAAVAAVVAVVENGVATIATAVVKMDGKTIIRIEVSILLNIRVEYKVVEIHGILFC